ncbi:type II secretion system F family protein [Sciscionella sediminilitoris]|uniref:type II secretion system F family protein n=1 Tax=Sciscionella sediminilitoris TaxID=1445613 RepID=UPI000A9F0590|nr:type II secretion system F family protein [Sciscionella sp. SE31]
MLSSLAALALALSVVSWPSVPIRARKLPAMRLPRYGLAVLAAIAVGALLATFGAGVGQVALTGLGSGVLVELLRRRSARQAGRVSPVRLAASWDLFAACLRGGLDVPRAVTVIAGNLPDPAAGALRRTADLLALGADAEQAWRPALAEPATEALGSAAVRSARSGTALAEVAAGLAVRMRAESEDAANAEAQRCGVLVSGPLGCCFLPAFFCLGVVPVVLGLAGTMLASW